MIVPEPFDEETLAQARKLRWVDKMRELMLFRSQMDIPEELDSIFFIARYLRANDGDINLSKLKLVSPKNYHQRANESKSI